MIFHLVEVLANISEYLTNRIQKCISCTVFKNFENADRVKSCYRVKNVGDRPEVQGTAWPTNRGQQDFTL